MQDLKSLCQKLILISESCEKVELGDNKNELVLLFKSGNDNILVISNKFQNAVEDLKYYIMENIRGNLKVFGGRNIQNISKMFANSILDTLDLTEAEFCNATVANGLCMYANIERIKIKSLWNIRSAIDAFEGTWCKILKIGDRLEINNVNNMNGMFQKASIGILDLSEMSTENCTSMERMFAECEIEDYINIDNFNTSKVESMQLMFAGANIKRLNISSFNTENVKYMQEMFFQSDINEFIPCKFNMKNTMYLGGFLAYSNFKSIELELENTENIVDTSRMFQCSDIKEFHIKGLQNNNIGRMNEMFSGCTVDELIIDWLDTKNVSSMAYMFSELHADYLDISNFRLDSLVNTEGMFEYAEIDTVKMPDINTDLVTTKNAFKYTKIKNLKINEKYLSI